WRSMSAFGGKADKQIGFLSPYQNTRPRNPSPTADLRRGTTPARIRLRWLVLGHLLGLTVPSPEQAIECSCRVMGMCLRGSDWQLARSRLAPRRVRRALESCA